MRLPVAVTGPTAIAALAAGLFAHIVRAQDQKPTFRSGTEVVLIDAQVVTRDGVPMEGLTPAQFEVFIDGRKRAIQSMEFIRSAVTPPVRGKAAVAPAPSSTPVTGDGRIVMIAIDQPSFPLSAQSSAREAAQRVAATAAPEDRVGLMTLPGHVRVAPTRDRAPIAAGIKQIIGLREPLKSQKFSLSVSEASAIKGKDGMTFDEVYKRECEERYLRGRDYQALQVCRMDLQQESNVITLAMEHQGVTSINGLYDTIDSMASIEGRKTLVFVSAGIPLSRRTGGVPNLDHELAMVGRRAAAANINLYVFYMNVHFLRAFSAEYGKQNHSLFEDISMFGYGLEKFADTAGGSFAQVEVDSDPFVDRMFRETSAYYLLTVPVLPAERDGKEHFIRLTLNQRGATVQHRKVVIIPKTN